MNGISIIIPVYNAEKNLERCLNSIKEQSYTKYEIIIINDGSKDKSISICEHFKELNKNISIKIITQINSGPSIARNKGIENANNNFIMFVDSDDYLEKDMLENLLNNYEQDMMIRSNYKVIKNNTIIEQKHENGIIKCDTFIKKILNGAFIGSVWGCLLETEIAKKIQFESDLYFMEDTLFLIKYLSNVKYVKIVNTNYIYCFNNNSITSSRKNILNNVMSFIKSLDKINEFTNCIYEKNVDNKKIVLIEKEISKIKKYNELKEIVNHCDFIRIINKIKKNNIKKRLYKLILNMLLKRKCVKLYIYIFVRNCLKKIKNIIKFEH